MTSPRLRSCQLKQSHRAEATMERQIRGASSVLLLSCDSSHCWGIPGLLRVNSPVSSLPHHSNTDSRITLISQPGQMGVSLPSRWSFILKGLAERAEEVIPHTPPPPPTPPEPENTRHSTQGTKQAVVHAGEQKRLPPQGRADSCGGRHPPVSVDL